MSYDVGSSEMENQIETEDPLFIPGGFVRYATNDI